MLGFLSELTGEPQPLLKKGLHCVCVYLWIIRNFLEQLYVERLQMASLEDVHYQIYFFQITLPANFKNKRTMKEQ